MTENTPAAPTDAELAAAIDRGIAQGTLVLLDDDVLARLTPAAGESTAVVGKDHTWTTGHEIREYFSEWRTDGNGDRVAALPCECGRWVRMP